MILIIFILYLSFVILRKLYEDLIKFIQLRLGCAVGEPGLFHSFSSLLGGLNIPAVTPAAWWRRSLFGLASESIRRGMTDLSSSLASFLSWTFIVMVMFLFMFVSMTMRLLWLVVVVMVVIFGVAFVIFTSRCFCASTAYRAMAVVAILACWSPGGHQLEC